jgi:hypothetical protein
MFGVLGLEHQAAQPLPCLAPTGARRYDVLYVVELGEEPCAKSLAPGSTCGGCRSRVSCGLLRGCSCYRSSPYCVDDLRCRRAFILRSRALLGRGSDGFAFRLGEPLAVAPRARCQRGTGSENHTALGPLFLWVCAYLFLVLDTVSPVPPLMALAALIATPAIGSLGAILEGGMIAARPLRATLIAAVAIYCASCASLFAFWSVSGDDWHGVRAGMVVAAASWPVLPGIVAMLRSG